MYQGLKGFEFALRMRGRSVGVGLSSRNGKGKENKYMPKGVIYKLFTNYLFNYLVSWF